MASVAGHGAALGVEFDACGAEDSRAGGGLAAGESAYPEDQLREVEGLGEVVVGTEAEAADPVLG